MTTFELLRINPVNLMRYLPDFLASDEHFSNTQASLSKEHEQLRLWVIDLLKQFFVETATWGLDDWERVYGLTSSADDSYDIRRGRLKAKILGAQTVTRAVLEEMVNSVIPQKDATVTENIAPGVFRVDLGPEADLTLVKQMIELYKPAHLSVQYNVIQRLTEPIYVGGKAYIHTFITIPPPVSSNEVEQHITFGGKIVFCRIQYI